MGKYSILLVGTLVFILTFFIISTTNTSNATIMRNVDTFEYNNAKNVANSAAQLVIHNIINRQTGWVFDSFPSGQITSHPLTSYNEWEELNGRYKVKRIVKGADNLIVTVSGESDNRVYDTVIHFREIASTTTLFDYAAYSKYDFTNYVNGYIDSFHPDEGMAYKGNAKVGYGPSGTFTNNGTINGTVSHKVDKVLPSVQDPGGGDPLVIPNSSMTITGGNYRVIGDIILSGNRVVQFSDGPTTLYVDGDIKTSGNAEIRINEGASLTIFLNGELDNRGNGLVNATGLAKNMIIYGTDQCTLTIDIQGSNNTTFTGAIYAPDAKVIVRGGNNFTVFGAIVGREIEISRNLIYDESLADFDADDIVVDTRYYVLSWQ